VRQRAEENKEKKMKMKTALEPLTARQGAGVETGERWPLRLWECGKEKRG
jgi:hypothetical protein